MKGFERAFLVLLLVPVLMVSACSNPLDSSESGVSAGLGIDMCYSCHLDTAYTYYNPSFALTIQQIFTTWASSGHSNLETYYSAGYGATLFGFPDMDNYLEDSCVPCHDPNMDSRYVPALTAAGAPGGSTTLRPVVGCEACHGSGDGHINAFFAVPYPAPDYERCGQCHNSDFDHNQHHPEADNLVEDYRGSKHNQSLGPFTSFPIAPLCSACHTDEGSRAYVDTDWTDIPSGDPPVSDAHPVQCRTCHDAHDPGKLYASAGGTGSEEFRLCNRCHLLDNGSGSPGVHYHQGWGDDYIVTDTHIATAGDWTGPGGANLNSITGYAMSYSDERVCRNCHNVHSGNIEINQQWASSAHADTSALGAWAHYNWTNANRRDCQRCHTAAGVIEYLTTNPMAGTDYAAPLTTDVSYNPEMLHCKGCHSDNAGSLREPGPITGDYAGAPFFFPDVGGSNVCMACHIGRESGMSIQNKSADFTSVGFTNSHYLSAGGTIFQATGYEYAVTYANFGFYEHDQIGLIAKTSSVVGGTDKGPCVGCHLSSPESHHFLPVEHDESGHITAVTSKVCSKCHTGSDARTPALLEEEKELFEAALGALESAMADTVGGMKPPFYFASRYPYIFQDQARTIAVTNWASIGDTSTGSERTGKPNMGAVFNYNLLEHDPGAFAHNSLYARLLIFDSIDWLDNNLIDGVIDLTAFPEAAEYLQRDSITGNDGAALRP